MKSSPRLMFTLMFVAVMLTVCGIVAFETGRSQLDADDDPGFSSGDTAEDGWSGIEYGATTITKYVGESVSSSAPIPAGYSVKSITGSVPGLSFSSNSTKITVSGTLTTVGTFTVEIVLAYGGSSLITQKLTYIYDVLASPVSVTGVKVSPTSLSIKVGDTSTLTATISPSNASNKSVSWTSSNTSVATVNSSGVVTAKAAGTATIKVTTSDGSKTASCTVKVSSAPTTYSYTIHYDANGGSGAPSDTTTSSTSTSKSITLSSVVPTSSYYHFMGWAKSSTATTAAYQPGSSYTFTSGTTNLYAVWGIELDIYKPAGGSINFNSSTISFTSNPMVYYVKPGASIELEWVSASGYSFRDWSLCYPGVGEEDNPTSNPYTFRTYEDVDVSVYLVQTKTYTLQYNANGGSGKPSSQTWSGTDTSHTFTISSTTPVRSGYTFAGWATTSTATSAQYQPGNQITVSWSSDSGNKTLYAVWNASYQVKVYLKDYESFYWYGKESSGAHTSDYTYTVSEGEEIDIDWVGKTVSETSNGYVIKKTSTPNCNNMALSYGGSSIGDSVLVDETTGPFYPTTTSTVKYSLYVIYDANGGTSAPSASSSVDQSSTSISMNLSTSKPTKDGYQFLGWAESKTATTASYTSGQQITKTYGAYTLYAVWKQITYDLTIKKPDFGTIKMDGTAISFSETWKTYTIVKDTTVKLEWVADNSTHTFYRWYYVIPNDEIEEAIAENPLSLRMVEDTDIEVYIYTSYSLAYNANGGSNAPTTQTWEGDRTTRTFTISSQKPSRTGYTFLGWADSSTATTSAYSPGSTIKIDGSSPTKTLYAVWEENTHEVTIYKPDTGTITKDGSSISYTSGKAVYSIRDGTSIVLKWTAGDAQYTFEQWYLALRDSGVEDYEQSQTLTLYVNEDTDIYVDLIHTYKITFNANGGSGAPSAQTYGPTSDSQHEFTLPATAPTKTNKVFVGWATTSTASTAQYQPGSKFTMTASSLSTTLYAVWEDKVKITAGSGGDTITLTSNIACSWDVTNNSGYAVLSSKINASSTVVTPRTPGLVTVKAYLSDSNYDTIELNICALAYYNMGGTGYQSPSIYIQTGLSSHTFTVSNVAIEKEGYIFKGWTDVQDSTTVKYTGNATISVGYRSETTLYPVLLDETMLPEIVLSSEPTLTATVGTKWSYIPTATPSGVTMTIENAPSWATKSGLGVTGTPTADGVFDFTLKYTKAEYKTLTKEFSLTVQKGIIQVSNEPSTVAKVKQAWSYSPSVNTTGYTVSVSGASWLSVEGNTVTGTPTYEGPFNITITISKNGYDPVYKIFTLTVESGPTITKVTIEGYTHEIQVDKVVRLTAQVIGEGDPSSLVEWSTSDSAVAIVNSTGTVTGKSPGTATIYATAVDDISKRGEYLIIVTEAYVSVTGITMAQNVAEVQRGDTIILSVDVEPIDATNRVVRWTSSDPDIASVNNLGEVTGLSMGTTTITATTVDKEYSAQCLVTVTDDTPVSSVSLDRTNASLFIGDKTKLNATVFPENATNKNMTWSSSDPSVATVSAKGTVTAISVGTATIKVTTESGAKVATCEVQVTKSTVEVVSVSLDSESLILRPNTDVRLNATASPSDATNKNVSWSSDNTQVATVDQNGLIHTIKAGTATIMVTTEDGGKKASCIVTVNDNAEDVPVQTVTLNMSSATIFIDEEMQLIAEISPSDATNKKIIWSSSNNNVVTVDSSGKVTAKATGTSTVTAFSEDGMKSDACEITVVKQQIHVDSIALSFNETTLTVGKTLRLDVTFNPSNATNKTVTWSSSNPEIATVSQAGIVSAKGSGTVAITATTVDGSKKATCTVTVPEQAITVQSLQLNKESLTIERGMSELLTVTILPSDATDKTVYWSSTDSAIASVNGQGKVNANAVGDVTIFVSTSDGSKVASCIVKVIEPTIMPESISLDRDAVEMNVGDSFQLAATVSPPNATNKEVSWTSSDANVVSVSSIGVVKAVSAGVAKITVSTADGTKSAECTITVIAPQETIDVEGVELLESSARVAVGQRISVDYNITPSNATNHAVIWSSSNDDVAGVDENGQISAVAPGVATITVTTVDGLKTDTLQITVYQNVTSVILDRNTHTMDVGEHITLIATVLPMNAENKNVRWSSSDMSIATVDSDGQVTAIAAGVATISVVTEDGSKSAACSIIVNQIEQDKVTVIIKKVNKDTDAESLEIRHAIRGTTVSVKDGVVKFSDTNVQEYILPASYPGTEAKLIGVDVSEAVLDKDLTITATYGVAEEESDNSQMALFILGGVVAAIAGVFIITRIR